MSRAPGWTLVLAAIALSTGCGADYSPEGARETKAELHELARARIEAGTLARTDGFVYAIDVALMMIYAANERDQPMYAALTGYARSHLVLRSPDDPYIDGFVVWRAKDGVEPDASGTTEALRISEGLWRGAEAFGDEADRELAVTILDGYLRHEGVDNGVWMIRNYFNLGTRAFATNSFLIDYAPDYVKEVARATGREDLHELARKSYALIESARTPSGLLYDIIQPEVATLLDDERMVLFSPNDAIQVSNTAAVALCAADGLPNVARGLLDFSRERMPELRGTYYGRTGEIARNKRPGIEAWASLVRLAVKLDDEAALEAFYPFLVSNAGRKWRIPKDAWLFVAAELLLGLQAVVPPVEAPA